MIDWPDVLVKDIARRRVVIVVGSGVSRHSTGLDNIRPPAWKEFLVNALRDCPDRTNIEHIQEAIKIGDFLHACEWIKERFDEGWVTYLRSTFNAPAFAPAPVHDSILKLDSRIVFSLNFDDIYERNANGIHRGSYIVKNYHDTDVSEFLRGFGRYIIKVHGNLHSADHIIFTQKDYSSARVAHSSFYQAFDAALLTHTFLFCGSGYSDPDINLILENQNFGFPTQSPHYFLTSHNFNHDRKKSLRRNRNLKVIEYDPIDENHSGLVAEINALVELVEVTRHEFAGNTNW